MILRDVYLTSYMRPELTEVSIEKVLTWKGLRNLIVVIDGLRAAADPTEVIWRAETIKLVEEFAKSQDNLDLWVYDKNVGITEHNMRIQGRALESGTSGIWIEEDIDLDFESFSTVLDSIDIENSSEPFLLSAYSHFNHFSFGDLQIKGNLFLPMWGIVFNRAFYELYCSVWSQKVYEPKIVEDALERVFHGDSLKGVIHKKGVLDYWREYSRWGFTNGNRWDAVANYALWTQSCFSYSTVNRFSNDLSYLDTRGMNQRSIPQAAQFHEFEKVMVGESIFCLGCETEGSRVPRDILPRITNMARYRIKKKFNKS